LNPLMIAAAHGGVIDTAEAMVPLLKDGMLMGQSGAPATIAKLPIKEAKTPAPAK
jgi:hypothetical protein